MVSEPEIAERQIRGNSAKYWSYREAWSRIKQAQEQGFYLEAVTIEESIITDRLISYLTRVGVIEQIEESGHQPGFAQLIDQWRRHCPLENTPDGLNLQANVNRWRQQRNTVVHGIVKLSPGAPQNTIIQFVEEAKQTAEDGERLARAVDDWVRRSEAVQS